MFVCDLYIYIFIGPSTISRAAHRLQKCTFLRPSVLVTWCCMCTVSLCLEHEGRHCYLTVEINSQNVSKAPVIPGHRRDTLGVTKDCTDLTLGLDARAVYDYMTE